MYFVGVTTAKSMIMRVFPKWARHLALGDCRIRGIDLAQHDTAERYRQVVSDAGYLDGVLREGAGRVAPIANSTVRMVKERMGLYVP